MTMREIEHFRAKLSRRLRGQLTKREQEQLDSAKETYNTIIENNGGKNPLLGF